MCISRQPFTDLMFTKYRNMYYVQNKYTQSYAENFINKHICMMKYNKRIGYNIHTYYKLKQNYLYTIIQKHISYLFVYFNDNKHKIRIILNVFRPNMVPKTYNLHKYFVLSYVQIFL